MTGSACDEYRAWSVLSSRRVGRRWNDDLLGVRCARAPSRPGKATSPAVMLSPNARNAFRKRARASTRDWERALAVRFSVSVAVQRHRRRADGRFRPEAGVHVTVTGGLPAPPAGVSKLTVRPLALTVARIRPRRTTATAHRPAAAAAASARPDCCKLRKTSAVQRPERQLPERPAID